MINTNIIEAATTLACSLGNSDGTIISGYSTTFLTASTVIDHMTGSAPSALNNYTFHVILGAAALGAQAAGVDPRVVCVVGTTLSASSVRDTLLPTAVASTTEKEEGIKAQVLKAYATYSAHAAAVTIVGAPMSACVFLAGSGSKISKVASLAFGSLAYWASQSSIAGAVAATLASRLFQ